MSFEVVSVKQNTTGGTAINRNFSWTTVGVPQTGGLFVGTNLPLYSYIEFAYKPTLAQETTMDAELPKWVRTERFDIEARAAGNPTMDQYRLMMRSLTRRPFSSSICALKRKKSPSSPSCWPSPGSSDRSSGCTSTIHRVPIHLLSSSLRAPFLPTPMDSHRFATEWGL
jgi:hypothetical protein